MTDIHISFYLGYRTNGSTNYFADFLSYNPDLILNSGDVVDSYEESYWPKVGSQWPGDWGIYAETIKKIYLSLKLLMLLVTMIYLQLIHYFQKIIIS